MTKKYVIKQADSNYYHSGYLEWNPHIDEAIHFDNEKDCINAINYNQVTLKTGVSLIIVTIYTT
jgi:hypothetical protein